MLAPALLLSILLGPAPSSLEPRVAAAVARLCPCRGDAACEQHHARAAHAIAVVAADDARPVDAAVKLLAAGAHESGLTDVDQTGGRAYGPWQIETTRALRASWRGDLEAQARWALRAARACSRHPWRVYASGSCERPVGVERELRAYEYSATFAWYAAGRSQ